MKPEHFIYKSEGLYYIQNMPVMEQLYCDCIVCIKAAEVNYKNALELAKAEAVPFNDYFLGLKRILHSMNISCGEGNEDLVRIAKLHLKEGQVYTINMEEKIEIVDGNEIEDFEGSECYPIYKQIARIEAPKKEDDPFKLVEMCNFPEDYAHENGNYINKCHSCGFYFKGHKRRVTCKMCSEFTLEEWKRIAAMKTPEDTKHAHAGCWLQGEMVGYARCMVKWLESAPKKEEETRSIIWNEWLSKVVDGEGYIMPTKFREAQKHFEIKRKPL